MESGPENNSKACACAVETAAVAAALARPVGLGRSNGSWKPREIFSTGKEGPRQTWGAWWGGESAYGTGDIPSFPCSTASVYFDLPSFDPDPI